MTHELKILPKYFDDVKNHVKNFELRRNDRDFKVGDMLILKEWSRGKYTGREYSTQIIYILDDRDMLMNDYVILGLAVPHTKVTQNGNNCSYIHSLGSMVIK